MKKQITKSQIFPLSDNIRYGGFTFLEVLIAIAITGVFLAIVYLSAQSRRDNLAQTDLNPEASVRIAPESQKPFLKYPADKSTIPKADFTVTDITDIKNKTALLAIKQNQNSVYVADSMKKLLMEVNVLPQSGYTYEWTLTGFDKPVSVPTGNKFIGEINPTEITSGSSAYYSITLTVRDSSFANAGTVTKGITVYSLPSLTGVTFKTPSVKTVTVGMPWAIPGLTLTGTNLPLTLCDTLKAGNVSLTPSPSGTTFFTPDVAGAINITCDISKGKTGKYIAEKNITVKLSIAVTQKNY